MAHTLKGGTRNKILKRIVKVKPIMIKMTTTYSAKGGSITIISTKLANIRKVKVYIVKIPKGVKTIYKPNKKED